MLKAAEGPVFSIAGLLPPHLIVDVSQWIHVIQLLLLLLLPSCCNICGFCSSAQTRSFWAAQYNNQLLIKLMPKGAVVSFLFFSTQSFFSVLLNLAMVLLCTKLCWQTTGVICEHAPIDQCSFFGAGGTEEL